MSNSNTELYKALLSGSSIDEIIRKEIEDTINLLLKTELTSFLDYEPYDPIGYNSGNSRNGSYSRNLKTKYGEITVEIPRDRNGEFKQRTIAPYKRNTDDLETTILHLYSKGITTSEIADLIEKMYGHAYSKQTISNITKTIQNHVKEFHERRLNKQYVVVYMDATILNVRRDSVSKEAVHILVGITKEGYKEVLDFGIYPSESCENYKEMLQSIQKRGCSQILLFVSDGLTGIKDACLSVYPEAKHQSCWVHISRNVARLVRSKDRKEILDMLKSVYQSKTEEEAILNLESFISSVSKRYPKVIDKFKDRSNLFSFLSFPKEIQRSLYSTNLIEGLNKQLKRYTKRKEQFPNEDSLERFICDQFMEYNQRFSCRIHKGFDIVQSELHEMFEK